MSHYDDLGSSDPSGPFGAVTGQAASDDAAAATVLEARGIERSYKIGGRSLGILHGVELELRRGERLALMGSSGAGKTTLLNILGLLDRPNSGTVRIQGVSAWDLDHNERAALRNRSIGFVFQFYHLLAELDAVENVMLPAMIGLPRSEYRSRRKELRGHAREMLERFGLGDRLSHRPGEMSGGEQQRVAIARALILDPPILIADEPTGNLDSATGERVLELLLDEQGRRGTSLLLVTHDERLAHRCQRIVRMQDGRVATE
ncbi:MAG: ABC transporter ATP-binding protein [Planctomycetota bacterium]